MMAPGPISKNIIRSGATVADAFLRIITHCHDGTGEAARATLPTGVLDGRKADSDHLRSVPRTRRPACETLRTAVDWLRHRAIAWPVDRRGDSMLDFNRRGVIWLVGGA